MVLCMSDRLLGAVAFGALMGLASWLVMGLVYFLNSVIPVWIPFLLFVVFTIALYILDQPE